ncbi:hypothetical protein RFI_23724 [Reticulomyxa filosa]|uniref:Uncharacterized protein n=1 Tax=Reticulomyxa filosa TaxID=46433 RepID=X6MID5_RETFI|nr:hypothetical protein RFI_23724 [Reticulomyxa filosa]|eukprot:ETO13644.1 hypothetical protein RFI_23724 [Reticulomyxa filosa]
MKLVHQMIEEILGHQKEFAQFLDTSVLSIVGNLEKTCEREYESICNRKKASDKNLKKLKNEAAKMRKETSDAAENVIKSRQKSDNTNSVTSPKTGDSSITTNLFQLLGKNKLVSKKTKLHKISITLKQKIWKSNFRLQSTNIIPNCESFFSFVCLWKRKNKMT